MYVISCQQHTGQTLIARQRAYYEELQEEGKLSGSIERAVSLFLQRRNAPKTIYMSVDSAFDLRLLSVPLGPITRTAIEDAIRRPTYSSVLTRRTTFGICDDAAHVCSAAIIFGRRIRYIFVGKGRTILAPDGCHWYPGGILDDRCLYVSDGTTRIRVTSDMLLVPNPTEHIASLFAASAAALDTIARAMVADGLRELR